MGSSTAYVSKAAELGSPEKTPRLRLHQASQPQSQAMSLSPVQRPYASSIHLDVPASAATERKRLSTIDSKSVVRLPSLASSRQNALSTRLGNTALPLHRAARVGILADGETDGPWHRTLPPAPPLSGVQLPELNLSLVPTDSLLRGFRLLRLNPSPALMVRFRPVVSGASSAVCCDPQSKLLLRSLPLQAILRDAAAIESSLELLDKHAAARRTGSFSVFGPTSAASATTLTPADSVCVGDRVYGMIENVRLPGHVRRRADSDGDGLSSAATASHTRPQTDAVNGPAFATGAQESFASMDTYLEDRGFALARFAEEWVRADRQARGAAVNAHAFCDCGCQTRWGEFCPHGSHPGLSQSWSKILSRARASGQAELLLLDPAGPLVGELPASLSFRAWHLASDTLDMLRSNGANRLRELRFGAQQSRQLTSKHLSDILVTLSCLVDLELPDCSALTLETTALFTRAASRASLLSLRVPRASNLDDTGLSHIALACSSLVFLDVSGCPLITDVGIKRLGESAAQLSALDISWCPGISHSGIAAAASDARITHLAARGLGVGFIELAAAAQLQRLREHEAAEMAHAAARTSELESGDAVADSASASGGRSVARLHPSHGGAIRRDVDAVLAATKEIVFASEREARQARATIAAQTVRPHYVLPRDRTAGPDDFDTWRRGVFNGPAAAADLALPSAVLHEQAAAEQSLMTGHVHGSPPVAIAAEALEALPAITNRTLKLRELALEKRLVDTQEVLPTLVSACVGTGFGGELLWLRHRVMGDTIDRQVYFEELDLEGAVGVTNTTILSLVSNCATLRRLKLAHCRSITSASTTAIGLFCPQLTDLVLAHCDGIVSPLFNQDAAVSIARKTNLCKPAGIPPPLSKAAQEAGDTQIRRVCGTEKSDSSPVAGLTPVQAPPGARPLTDAELRQVLRPRWRKLRLIDVSGCTGLWETDITQSLETCQDLVDVRLSGISKITDYSLDSLRSSGATIQRLQLRGCAALTDIGMMAVAESCLNLEELDISDCAGISDAGFHAIAKHCPCLLRFRASRCSHTVSIAAIVQLAQSCRQLRVLEAARPTKPAHAHFLPDGSGPPRSEQRPDLSFDGDMFLFLLSVAVCCPFLRQLDLSRHIPAGLQSQAKAAHSPSQRVSKRLGSAVEEEAVALRGVGAETDPNLQRLQAARASISRAYRGLERRPSGIVGHIDDTPPLPAPRTGVLIDGALPSAVPEHERSENAEVLFPWLARCALRGCGKLSANQLELLFRMAPRMDSLDVTGCRGVTLGMLSELASKRPTCTLVADIRPTASPGLALPSNSGNRSGRQAPNPQHPSPTDCVPEYGFLGLRPIEGACFARYRELVLRRLTRERLAANSIRSLVLHGIGKRKQVLYTITHRVRHHREARRHKAARRIQLAMRAFHEFMEWKRWRGATRIQCFWRRWLFVRRCAARAMDALEAKREAQAKRLASALLLASFDRVWERIGLDRMRIAALIGRWEDHRRRNQSRGLRPEYDSNGRFRVQFALPIDGPEVFGEDEVQIEMPSAPREQQLFGSRGPLVRESRALANSAGTMLNAGGSGRLIKADVHGLFRMRTTEEDVSVREGLTSILPAEATGLRELAFLQRTKYRPVKPESTSIRPSGYAQLAGIAHGGTTISSTELRQPSTGRACFAQAKYSAEMRGATVDARGAPGAEAIAKGRRQQLLVPGTFGHRPIMDRWPATTGLAAIGDHPASSGSNDSAGAGAGTGSQSVTAIPNPFRVKEGPISVCFARTAGVGAKQALRSKSRFVRFLDSNGGDAAKLDPDAMCHPLARAEEPLLILMAQLGPRADALRTLRNLGPALHAAWIKRQEAPMRLISVQAKRDLRLWRGLVRKLERAYRGHLARTAIRVHVKERIMREEERLACKARRTGLSVGGGYGLGTFRELIAIVALQRMVRGYLARLAVSHLHRSTLVTRAIALIEDARRTVQVPLPDAVMRAVSGTEEAQALLDKAIRLTMLLRHQSGSFRRVHSHSSARLARKLREARAVMHNLREAVSSALVSVFGSVASLRSAMLAATDSMADEKAIEALQLQHHGQNATASQFRACILQAFGLTGEICLPARDMEALGLWPRFYGPHGGRLVDVATGKEAVDGRIPNRVAVAALAEVLNPALDDVSESTRVGLAAITPRFVEHPVSFAELEAGAMPPARIIELLQSGMRRKQAHMSRWRIVGAEASCDELHLMLSQRLRFVASDCQIAAGSACVELAAWCHRWGRCLERLKSKLEAERRVSDPWAQMGTIRGELRIRILQRLFDEAQATEKALSGIQELASVLGEWTLQAEAAVIASRDIAHARLAKFSNELAQSRAVENTIRVEIEETAGILERVLGIDAELASDAAERRRLGENDDQESRSNSIDLRAGAAKNSRIVNETVDGDVLARHEHRGRYVLEQLHDAMMSGGIQERLNRLASRRLQRLAEANAKERQMQQREEIKSHAACRSSSGGPQCGTAPDDESREQPLAFVDNGSTPIGGTTAAAAEALAGLSEGDSDEEERDPALWERVVAEENLDEQVAPANDWEAHGWSHVEPVHGGKQSARPSHLNAALQIAQGAAPTRPAGKGPLPQERRGKRRQRIWRRRQHTIAHDESGVAEARAMVAGHIKAAARNGGGQDKLEAEHGTLQNQSDVSAQILGSDPQQLQLLRHKLEWLLGEGRLVAQARVRMHSAADAFVAHLQRSYRQDLLCVQQLEATLTRALRFAVREKQLRAEHGAVLAEAETLDWLADNKARLALLSKTRKAQLKRANRRVIGLHGLAPGLRIQGGHRDGGSGVRAGRHRVPEGAGQSRAIPPTASASRLNGRFYSDTGDCEDFGNAAFWYAGPPRRIVVGLLGVRMAMVAGVAGGGASLSSDSEAEPTEEALEAKARAVAERKQAHKLEAAAKKDQRARRRRAQGQHESNGQYPSRCEAQAAELSQGSSDTTIHSRKGLHEGARPGREKEQHDRADRQHRTAESNPKSRVGRRKDVLSRMRDRAMRSPNHTPRATAEGATEMPGASVSEPRGDVLCQASQAEVAAPPSASSSAALGPGQRVLATRDNKPKPRRVFMANPSHKGTDGVLSVASGSKKYGTTSGAATMGNPPTLGSRPVSRAPIPPPLPPDGFDGIDGASNTESAHFDWESIFGKGSRLASQYEGFGGAALDSRLQATLQAANEADFGFRAIAVRESERCEKQTRQYAEAKANTARTLRQGSRNALRRWLEMRKAMLAGDTAAVERLVSEAGDAEPFSSDDEDDHSSDSDAMATTSQVSKALSKVERPKTTLGRILKAMGLGSTGQSRATSPGRPGTPSRADVERAKQTRRERLARRRIRQEARDVERLRGRCSHKANPFDTSATKADLDTRVPVQAFQDLWLTLVDPPRSQGGHGTGRQYYVHIATGHRSWAVPTWRQHRELDARAFHLAEQTRRRGEAERLRSIESAARRERDHKAQVRNRLIAAGQLVTNSGARLLAGNDPDDNTVYNTVKIMRGAADLEKEMRKLAPGAIAEAAARDDRVFERMARMPPQQLEAFKGRLFDTQAGLDAQDLPAWWASLSLQDDSHEAVRGLAGGSMFAGSEDAYAQQVELQAGRVASLVAEVARLRRLAELDCSKLMDDVTNALEGIISSFQPPRSVTRLVAESTKLTDARARLAFDKRAKAARARLSKAEREATTKRLARAVAEQRREAASAFQSAGFQGVVGPDGSMLLWAGDGTEFVHEEWSKRRRSEPWRLNAVLVNFIMSQRQESSKLRLGRAASVDSDSLADAALHSALINAGGLQLLQRYRLGTETDHSDSTSTGKDGEAELEATSGLEARRRAVQRRQELAGLAMREDPAAARLVRAGLERARREDASRRRQQHLEALALQEAADRQQCVEAVAVTWGHEETASFARAQSEATEKCEPAYWLVDHDLGRDGVPVRVWARLGWVRSKGLSDVAVAPSDDADPLSAALSRAGFDKTVHSTALGTLALWHQSGGVGRPIAMLRCTTTTAQEQDARAQSFRKAKGTDGLVGEFLSPTAALWFTTAQPSEPFVTPDGETHLALQQEQDVLRAYAQSIEEDFAGGDVTVDTSAAVARARAEPLDVAVGDKEQDALELELAKAAVHDPVAARERERISVQRALARCRDLLRQTDTETLNVVAADFLGLERADMNRLQAVFLRLTRFHGGIITARELGRMLGMKWTPLTEAFVYFIDADINPDAVSAAAFVRGFAVPCSFAMAEIIAFLFFVVAPNMAQEVPIRRSRPHLSNMRSVATSAAVFHDDAAPRDYWRHSCGEVLALQARRGTRSSDPHHTLRCVFSGRDTHWSGVVTPAQIDSSAPMPGLRRALGMLAWGRADSTAVVQDAIDQIAADSGNRDAGTFVAFKRAITLNPRLMLTAAAVIRGLRSSILGLTFWETKDVDFARAGAVVQSRLEHLEASKPAKFTAEEALAAVLGPP